MHIGHAAPASLRTKIDSELAKPEPEPVAWMYDVADIDDGDIESRLHFHKPLDCVSNIKNVMPLYTSLPQQKPLSEDAILKIINELEEDDYLNEWEKIAIRQGIRLAEKAHGIP